MPFYFLFSPGFGLASLAAGIHFGMSLSVYFQFKLVSEQ
jgi:hypothetical protein